MPLARLLLVTLIIILCGVERAQGQWLFNRSDKNETGAEQGVPSQVRSIEAFESFNPRPYRLDTLPGVSVVHDVPYRLMSGQADRGTVQVVSGYRIQLIQTTQRSEALTVEAAINNFLEREDRSDALWTSRGDRPGLYIQYAQPYYRVRLGDFISEGDARRGLSVLEAAFPSAIVVYDQVEIIR
jgi:hypothetical protein